MVAGSLSKKPVSEIENGPSDDQSSDDSRNWTHCTRPGKGARDDSGSVSNSEGSGAESVTTNNLPVTGSGGPGNRELLPFFDFLGVGAA